jgi:hypothetical protein
MRDVVGTETLCLTYLGLGCGLRRGKTHALVSPLGGCPQRGAGVVADEAR